LDSVRENGGGETGGKKGTKDPKPRLLKPASGTSGFGFRLEKKKTNSKGRVKKGT